MFLKALYCARFPRSKQFGSYFLHDYYPGLTLRSAVSGVEKDVTMSAGEDEGSVEEGDARLLGSGTKGLPAASSTCIDGVFGN